MTAPAAGANLTTSALQFGARLSHASFCAEGKRCIPGKTRERPANSENRGARRAVPDYNVAVAEERYAAWGDRFQQMHELALSQNIVDIVVERARREGVHAVTRITVEVGMAAGVEPDALRFCFDIVTADTLARGAELAIETIALQARCRACTLSFEPASLVSPCPHCGSYGPLLERGGELRVKSFDGE